ncbi:hypothetical protein [Pseudomonas sp. B21-048]|uniref:hypothetical protein n=1 Tax=Pseudomonas sp. B21-048 TaxID=2895490 RepID=UPI00216043C7|nr:hypothetical protein [Pseudomonas sp. B21-048]UVK96483.1 hypothetical protein LOY56_13720 [Pseudomonas sp. B21-048]
MENRNDGQVTPSPIISTPPPSEPTWTMQAINRLDLNIVSLTHAVETLVKQADAAEKKSDEAAKSLVKIERTIYAAGAIVALLVVVGGFIVNKAVDFGMTMAKDALKAQAQVVAPPMPVDPPFQKRK